MTWKPRSNHPYAHAARVPDGDAVPVEALLRAGQAGDPEGEAPAGPFEIEIGPGRGGFLFERAAARPDIRLVGLEIRMKWAAIVDARLIKAGLGARVRCLNADAREALPRIGPDASVSVFYLHFPDPWWKKRHEKRLVMGDVILDAVARLLRDGGELFVQTDVEERAAQYAAQIATSPHLTPAGDSPGSPHLADNPYDARSPREHRAIADGLPVHRLRYRRKARA